MAHFYKLAVVTAVLGMVTAFSSIAGDKFSIVQTPYLQDLGETGVTVVWETSAPSLGWVEIAPDDGSHFYACDRPQFYDAALGTRKIGKLHKVTLTGLEPATTYRYRVISKEVLDTVAGNATFYFALVINIIGLILGFMMLLSPIFTLNTIRYFASAYLILLGIDSVVIAVSRMGRRL